MLNQERQSRFDSILQQIKDRNEDTKEYCVNTLSNIVFDLSDPLIREPVILEEDIKSCLDLVETIERVYGSEDYRIFVVGWFLVSGVFNTLHTMKSPQKEQTIERLRSMFDILIKFRCLKDVNSLNILKQQTVKDEFPHQLIPFMKQRLKSQLTIIIEHVKKDNHLLIALMGLRALAYHQKLWRCIEDILDTDILLPLFQIASDTYNIISDISDDWTELNFRPNNQDGDGKSSQPMLDFQFNQKSRKLVHLICNESIRLITNLTSGDFETTNTIVNQKAIPFFMKLLDSLSSDIQHYALNGIGNIIFEKEEWRDIFIEEYALLEMTKGMLSDPTFKTTEFVEDFSNIFAAITYGDSPSILWDTIRGILPYVKKYLMGDSSTTRGNVVRILEYTTLHPEFDYRIFIQFEFDKFLIDCLSSGAQNILEPTIYAIGNIFQKAQFGTISLCNAKLMDHFMKILRDASNQHLMRLVLWIISNMVVGESTLEFKSLIINHQVIKYILDMVLKYQIESPPPEDTDKKNTLTTTTTTTTTTTINIMGTETTTNPLTLSATITPLTDTTPITQTPNVDTTPISQPTQTSIPTADTKTNDTNNITSSSKKKIMIEAKTVEEIMWVIGNLICHPITEQQIEECVQQGVLILLCKLYPYVPSNTCYLNLIDSFEYIIQQTDQQQLYIAHLIELGFHQLTPNPLFDFEKFEALLDFFNQDTNPTLEEDYHISMSRSYFNE